MVKNMSKTSEKDIEKELKKEQKEGPEDIKLPGNEKDKKEDKKEEKDSKQEKESKEEKETEGTGISFPAEWKIPSNPVIYAGIGIAVIALLVILFGKKKKNKVQSETLQTTDITQREVCEEGTETDISSMEMDDEKQIVCIHEIGSREDQQDSYGFSEEVKGTLLVAADGMGGLNNGGQISSLAVTSALNLFRMFPEYMSSPDMLLEMAGQVNNNVNQFLRGKQRGGSTLIASIVRNGYLHFLTIGDSRIYLYRNGALIQLNREHIYKEELALEAVNRMIPVGRIHADAQAASLTSYLGEGNIAHLDRNLEGIRLVDKDRILIASDGVFGSLITEQIEAALSLPLEEAAEKMKDMVYGANKPHQDNFTALIYEYKNK